MIKKVVSNILTGLLVLLVVSQVILLLCGFKIMYVKTESMSPDIPKGALIYVKNYKSQEDFYEHIKIGDDITYKTLSGTVVTHRIIKLDKENNSITTQGIIKDAMVDEPITYNQVIGKVRTSIPLLGYLIMMFQTWYFWLILICAIVIIVLTKYLVKELKKNKE